jgi:DNA-binding response OmpR family regulator
MSAAGRAYTENTGADAILLKPFDLEEVEALLQRFLPPPVSRR